MVKTLLINRLAPALAAAALMFGCASSDEESADTSQADAPKITYAVLAEFVTPEDSLSQLRFHADGLISLNDQCPVRKVRLNLKMAAAYVNGEPVGFC
jgi:hypothetical protein